MRGTSSSSPLRVCRCRSHRAREKTKGTGLVKTTRLNEPRPLILLILPPPDRDGSPHGRPTPRGAPAEVTPVGPADDETRALQSPIRRLGPFLRIRSAHKVLPKHLSSRRLP